MTSAPFFAAEIAAIKPEGPAPRIRIRFLFILILEAKEP
jgi:hypothetical protein